MKMEQRQSRAKLEGSMGFGDERQITKFIMITQKKREGKKSQVKDYLLTRKKLQNWKSIFL